MHRHILTKLQLSPIWKVLLFSTVLYFFLSIFTYHPDNKIVLFWASLEGPKIINVWEYGQQYYPTFSQFNYPPFHYIIDKVLYFIAVPIGGQGFTEWLATPYSMDPYVPELARYTLALKAGLILIGILTGYLVFRIARKYSSERNAVIAAALWLCNPVTLYSIPIMGQNDVLAILFFLLGWLALSQRKVLATVLFGLAASIKIIPLIWLPFLLVAALQKEWKKAVFILLGAVSVYIATLLPFMDNANFRSGILTGNHGQRFLYAELPFGFGEAVKVVPVLLLVLLVGVLIKKYRTNSSGELVSFALMSVSAVLLGFGHFHPQWYTWVVVFWALWMISVPRQKLGFAIAASGISFLAWAVIVLLFKDAALTWGMLMPLNPFLGTLPSIYSVLTARGAELTQIIDLAHTWLAGISVVLLILPFIENTPNLHDRLQAPRWLNNVWQKLVQSSALRRALLTVSLVLTAFSVALAAHSIPVPISTQPPAPESITYLPLLDTYQVTLTPEHPNFNRVDLYLTSDDLAAIGWYTVTVSRGETVIHTQDISAGNIGNYVNLRIDFPPQANSHTEAFTVSLTPIVDPATGNTGHSEFIKVGVSNPNDAQNTLALKQFFTPSNNSIFHTSSESLVHVSSQVAGLLVLLIACILLL